MASLSLITLSFSLSKTGLGRRSEGDPLQQPGPGEPHGHGGGGGGGALQGPPAVLFAPQEAHHRTQTRRR